MSAPDDVVRSTLLSGLRVVEVSSFVAAPLGGMTLAQLGADVIRVDPLGGAADIRRWPLAESGTSIYWAGLNKSKRSVTVDFRSERGRDLVRGLVRERGVLLTNSGGRGWLSHQELAAVRPDLVHVQIDGRHDGSSAVDYTVNAATGFPFVTGPVGWGEPVNHVLPAWDVSCGLYAALALLAAERHRRATGEGSQIRVALEDVAVATAGNLGFLAEAEINRVDRTRIGNHLYGSFARDFSTRDGRRVMVVALTNRHWRELVDVTGRGGAVAAVEDALGVDLATDAARYRFREMIAGLLEPWFAERDLADVEARLGTTNVLWSTYRSFGELIDDARRAPGGSILAEIDQPGIGVHLAPGSPIAVGPRGRPVQVDRAPVLGEHTQGVLAAELRLTDDMVDGLVADGVAGAVAPDPPVTPTAAPPAAVAAVPGASGSAGQQPTGHPVTDDRTAGTRGET